MARIRSESADFQLLEALRHNRRKRTQRGEFLIEGVQPIDRALAAGWPVRAVLVPDERHAVGVGPLGARRAARDGRAPRSCGPTCSPAWPTARTRPSSCSSAPSPPPTLAELDPPDDGVVVVVDRPVEPRQPRHDPAHERRPRRRRGAHRRATAPTSTTPSTIRASVGSLFALPDASPCREPDRARRLARPAGATGRRGHRVRHRRGRRRRRASRRRRDRSSAPAAAPARHRAHRAGPRAAGPRRRHPAHPDGRLGQLAQRGRGPRDRAAHPPG